MNVFFSLKRVVWCFFSVFGILMLNSCSIKDDAASFKEEIAATRDSINTNVFDSIVVVTDTLTEKEVSEIEKTLISYGLVNIKDIDSTLVVDLRYSGTNNFMQADVYGDWENAYLQPDVAEKLALAQNILRSKYPYRSLIIFDAVRPQSVQQKMWDVLDLPVKEKTRYISNPKNGSIHNFGAAVDLSIVNENGEELDMGTPYDFFGELAYPRKEKELLAEGKLTEEQINNRKLLRNVMHTAGFFNIQTEWWHFNSCTREAAKQRYQLIK